LNEAYAVQVIYCRDKLGIDPEKLNVNGGSIAMGHPYGMTERALPVTFSSKDAGGRPSTAS
jgi:acetyl-CoA acetyltransferase